MDEKPFRYNIKGLADDMEVSLQTLSSLYFEFFNEMKLNIQESKAFCNSKNWEKLEREIHNIKGITSCLNVNDVYYIAQKLDVELKDHKYEIALSDINSISKLFERCETDIRGFFKKNGIIF